jgi:hypothetical protein
MDIILIGRYGNKGYTDEKPEIKWTEYYARYLLENYA